MTAISRQTFHNILHARSACRFFLFTDAHSANARTRRRRLPESRCAAAHDLALADKLGVEFGSVEGEVDVEVNAVEGALGCVHALKVLFEVLARQV
jgi:hypothetical protein